MRRHILGLCLLAIVSLTLPLITVKRATTQSPINVTVQTFIENGTVFTSTFGGAYIAVGDVTNDGNVDIVITKGKGSQAAVFQNNGGTWDNGTLLAGPSQTNANRPIIAPIRNDGQNWLVYDEHLGGNANNWLRAHRYDGTVLLENKDISSRFAWPGWFAPNVGDLDGDGNVEIWFISLHGSPTLHLRRHIWDAAINSYPGVEIKDGGDNWDIGVKRPVIGDFLGNGTQSLIWIPGRSQLDLVTYTPGSGVHDHTSSPIFTPPNPQETVIGYAAGEFDNAPGTDIVIATSDGTSTLYLVSGGTFSTRVLTSGFEFVAQLVMGDLDGDGLSEVYAAGNSGKIFGYDDISGWRELADYPGTEWFDGLVVRWPGATRDEVLFSSPVGGRTFRVISLSAEPVNNSPDCSNALPSVDTLWPPNHEFATVEVFGVTDPDEDTVLITIDSIYQDEPVDSTGDGSFAPDGQGVGASAAEVRAERDGSGNGRVYHIYFTADDGRGGTCTGEVLVGVPKSQGKHGVPVDDGPLCDSTVFPE